MSKLFKLDNKNYRYEFKIWLSATCAFGTLRFQVFEWSFTTEVFLEFLRRLVRSTKNKVLRCGNTRGRKFYRHYRSWGIAARPLNMMSAM